MTRKKNYLCNPQIKYWRMQVLERDDNRCVSCEQKFNVLVRHILPKGEFPALACDPSNGITLCTDCYYRLKSGDYVDICRLLVLRQKCLKGKEDV